MKYITIKRSLLVVILFLAAFIRMWKMDMVPSSLFGDELDVGYHAYSLLKTGRDYSGNFLPLHLHSLAEWRTPLYLYSAVSTVALFGISAYGVRLPAAIFGVLGVYAIYLLTYELANRIIDTKKGNTRLYDILPFTAAFFLAVSPWHIHYSRAAFEVTQLLFFLLLGLYFFYYSLRKHNHLWISVVLLVITPLIYSTAKLFIPFLLLFLVLVYFKEIVKLPKKQIAYAIVAGIIAGLPVIYGTFFSGGTERFSYISVFTDPTIEPEVGTARTIDALVRGDLMLGLTPSFSDRFFHNKVVFWTERITQNMLTPFSTEFLFLSGDPNDRHSVKGMGVFYKIDFIVLLLGIITFFARKNISKEKLFVLFWIFAGIVPSAITRDGGNHATRLILILPPFIILISYGFVSLLSLRKILTGVLVAGYLTLFAISFLFYQHIYWIHYSIDTERLWHAGHKEAMAYISDNEEHYGKVVLSMANEPIWIFFAAYSEYPPDKWHLGYPFAKTTLPGMGEVAYIDKYYFGNLQRHAGSIYDLPKFLDSDTLYLATQKEVEINLILEPERTPPGLRLLEAIPYPSGEPAFYFFEKI